MQACNSAKIRNRAIIGEKADDCPVFCFMESLSEQGKEILREYGFCSIFCKASQKFQKNMLTRQDFWYILWVYSKYCDRGALIISTLRDMAGRRGTQWKG